ncbi:MAG: prepilin-type N-terminal cleavage/methylation domain-containing protein [Patescibacteria group bacterium]
MVRFIKHKKYSKGITLIELVLYMGLFTILISGVLYSALYLEEIIEYNSFEYKARENIYRQLELLQHYTIIAQHIEIGSSSIRMQIEKGSIIQELREGKLYMKYEYIDMPMKEFLVYPYARFIDFSFTKSTSSETLSAKTELKVHIDRQDTKGRHKFIDEYILAPSS